MSDRKITGKYVLGGSSNGKTLDVTGNKASGVVELKVSKKLRLEAAFTEDVIKKGYTAPGSKLTLSQAGVFKLNYDLSKKDFPLSGDFTTNTKVDGKDLRVKAAWQQKDNAVVLTSTYSFDKKNVIEASYALASQNVGLKATHKTNNGCTVEYMYAHPSEAWSASVAKSAKSVNYKLAYDSKNNCEIKIVKNPFTLVMKSPLSNTPKFDVTATLEKGYTF